MLKEEGPPHDRTYTVIVKVDGIKIGEWTASSKKQAEQKAAYSALKKQAQIE